MNIPYVKSHPVSGKKKHPKDHVMKWTLAQQFHSYVHLNALQSTPMQLQKLLMISVGMFYRVSRASLAI